MPMAMYFLSIYILLATAVSAQIQHAAKGSCPPVWSSISKELTGVFVSNGSCNDDARAAIRAALHDCFPDGGCDGSIFLALELSRAENQNIGPTVYMLGSMAERHKVGIADMIQFAASHAIKSCSQGPRVTTYVGRKDSCTPAPINQAPDPSMSSSKSLAAFTSRGFTAEDLSALIGAHTISRQVDTVPAQAGASQDTTPDTWDTMYYTETLAQKAPFSFQSDISLSQDPMAGPFFRKFGKDKAAWDSSFTAAMTKLSLLGVSEADVLVDCTDALP